MQYPLQPIIDIAVLCAKKGVETAVLSPGSRNAPLVVGFVRHPAIKTLTISDERSAAFIGMGIAQQTQKPVVLCCTSGSAGLNYAPAVAEAFYQQIPLIILTADRPPEWIDQLDGQTIRQQNLFGKHVKASYELPISYEHEDARWQINRIVNEAINEAMTYPYAPVHINCPFREPFYPTANQTVELNSAVRVIENVPNTAALSPEQWENLQVTVHNASLVVVIAGQERLNPELLALFQSYPQGKFLIINDCIGNLHDTPHTLQLHDWLLPKHEALQNVPLLITFGKSVLSKNLKAHFRKYKAQAHWHLQVAGQVADTFQSVTKVIRTEPTDFFKTLLQKNLNFTENLAVKTVLADYQNLKAKCKLFFSTNNNFSEFEAIYQVINSLQKKTTQTFSLHLANSMTVRYVNALGVEGSHIEVFCNRGTSGIDGSNSTAVGHALANPAQIHVLITGDVAFFYDRNAFWHNYLPKNLKIILLNNGGGGIFKLIDAGGLPEADEYFVTRQNSEAAHLAKEFDLAYTFCEDRDSFSAALTAAMQHNDQTVLIELHTQLAVNQVIWQNYKSFLAQNG
jgi:2-succinyl-5-enolpyruvyl-6-hydroxy-3-cyclohexene-1-carboxylate synthase